MSFLLSVENLRTPILKYILHLKIVKIVKILYWPEDDGLQSKHVAVM